MAGAGRAQAWGSCWASAPCPRARPEPSGALTARRPGRGAQCTVRGGREGRDIDAVELARAVEDRARLPRRERRARPRLRHVLRARPLRHLHAQVAHLRRVTLTLASTPLVAIISGACATASSMPRPPTCGAAAGTPAAAIIST